MELSPGLLEMLERHRAATGVAPEHVIEQAVHHYLMALETLPADVVVPTRIAINARAGEAVLKAIEDALPPEPLAALLRDGD